MPANRPFTELEKELLRLAGFEDDISDDEKMVSESSSEDDHDVSGSDSEDSESPGDSDTDKSKGATKPPNRSCDCRECRRVMKKAACSGCKLASEETAEKNKLRELGSASSKSYYSIDVDNPNVDGNSDASNAFEQIPVRATREVMAQRQVKHQRSLPTVVRIFWWKMNYTNQPGSQSTAVI
ncbi:hypothetical protein K440DRAFT_643336 [Wilcoxina mikolae CBS 423.85]|nr:hypothetical protein K440DRAFT_643336 [Wilcoxina mikolae CBS 423.85]